MRPPGRRLHRPRSKGLQPRDRAPCGPAPTPKPQEGRPRTTGTLSGSPCPRPSSPGRSGRAEHRRMSSRSGRDSTCASKPWLLVRWSAVLQFNVVLEVLAPTDGLILRLRAATGEEQPALLVHDDRAHTDADVVGAGFHAEPRVAVRIDAPTSR